jgi:hypothetical protein
MPPGAVAPYPYSAAEPPMAAYPLTDSAPARRPWWKGPAGGFAAAVALTAIGVGAYFGIQVLLK